MDLNSEEEIAEYINKVLMEISKIQDEIHRELMLKTLAKEFDIGYNTLEKRLLSFIEKQEKEVPKIEIKKQAKKITKKDKYDKAAMSLLYYMLVNEKTRNLFENDKIYFPTEKQRFLASEILYYSKLYGIITIADFYTYLQNKEELLEILNEVVGLELKDEVDDNVILDYVKVLDEKRTKLEMERLKQMMLDKKDPLEQAKIAERMRKLKMGS